MSGQSSSGSWSGRGAGADIIDLDKFMRGAVRPSEPHHRHRQEHLNRLVVDGGGGAARKLPRPSSSTSGSASSAASKYAVQSHAKRFSHDSGLSDGTYKRRRHRPHRRASGPEGAGPRPPTSARTLHGSSDSLRAFRAVCERALLDQQEQIARVAQLCERLTERQDDHRAAPTAVTDPHPGAAPPRPDPDVSATADTSDISSSSCSTGDQRRKEKHRTDECKTYKIIMNKLDELNRLFAARAKLSPPAPSPGPGPPARRPPQASSASVSVSDKLVATEPELKRKTITPSNQGGASGAGGRARPAERSVTQSFVVDIAPADARPALHQHQHRPNVFTQSIIKCESSYEESGSSKCDPRCGFDLENPLHLYTQAKRLQAMHATSRRTRSADRVATLEERLDRHERSDRRERLEPSLCALCRGYWRSLRQYLAAQIFCRPDVA